MHIFGYKGWKHKLTKYKPAEAVDIVIRDIAPIFKAAGYKKIGRTWTKDMDGFSFIISIQASRWNGDETGAAFDAGYGIFVPQVFKALHTYEQPKNPKIHDCTFSQFISGRLQRVPWEIFDNTDLDALSKSVAVQIQEECIDAFAPIATLDDVKAQLLGDLLVGDHNGMIGLAVLCAEMGDSVNAKRYFDTAKNDQVRTPKYREWGEEIAARYKL